MFTPTNRQREFLFAKDKRINLLSGSVRSGKTYISLLKFGLWVASMPEDAEFLMVGKTGGSLNRNCFGYMYQFFGEDNFQVSHGMKGSRLFGRKLWLAGAADARAENQIRGMTLAGAYCDEVTLYPENFWVMLLTRLSRPGAKVYATCNPDNPAHFIKEKYIDRADELDCAVWNFLLTDNTYLGAEYLDNITKEFTGVFYDRYILGKWVKAEGLVYPMFGKWSEADMVDRPYSEYCISMDYGIQNPTAMLLWGLYDGVWYLFKEYYHSGRDTAEQKTDEQYYQELEKLAGDRQINAVYIDPSAASFITLVRQKRRFRVIGANNSVIEGIQHTASALESGKIKICSCCKHTIKEFGLYSWDSEAEEDVVIKENDHCLTGETEVHTLFGKRRIKDLVGKVGLAWSYRKGRKVLRPFFGVRKTGCNQQIYKIVCENGKTIRCTGEHRILTDSGWKQAKYLSASDSIVDISD